jgi:hypothetical protein
MNPKVSARDARVQVIDGGIRFYVKIIASHPTTLLRLKDDFRSAWGTDTPRHRDAFYNPRQKYWSVDVSTRRSRRILYEWLTQTFDREAIITSEADLLERL